MNRQLVFKRPELLNGFQGRDFKDSVRDRVTGSVVSLCTVL